MTAGLEIRNDYGTFLITDRDPSLALREKRSVNSAGGFGSTTFTGVENPIVAFRSDAIVCAVRQVRSGSNLQLFFRTIPASASVQLYVFDRPVPSSATYGLQVFDESGRCTFDSNRQYGRVVASNPATGNWVGQPGRVYAGAILSQRWQHQFENTNEPDIFDHYYYSCAVQAIPDGLWTNPLFGYQVVPESSPSRPDDYFTGSPQPLIVVLDVTGY